MSTDVVELPSPEDRPDADVLIFDGNCQFCRKQVERLFAWDSRQKLAFLSLHDPLVAERYPDLSREQLMEQMYLADSNNRRFGGAAAFRELTRKIPWLYPLAPLLHLPFTLPLWQWAYRQVAKRRYRISGHACDGDSCKVHFD